MTHGWGSCQGEGRQGHTRARAAREGKAKGRGVKGKVGARLVTEQGRSKQERERRREGEQYYE